MALKDETVQETAGLEHRPSSPSRRLGPLYATMPLANVVLYTIWTAVPGFLLPVQVQRLTGSTDVSALSLASMLGAIAATIGNPILGQLSDRTRSRFGRRAPWMVACALVGAVVLLLQSAAPSILLLGIAYAGTNLILNGFQVALTAVVPDRFPPHKLGLASSLMGVGLNTGVLAGSLMFVFFPGLADEGGYYLLAALIIIAAFGFAVISPDTSSKDLPREPFRLKQFLTNSFWVSPRKHPDFAWVFLARVLLMLGYWLVFGFFFFALQDYIGLSAERAVVAAGTLYTVNGAASIVGSLIAAPLADRFGSLKTFVLIAGAGLALSLLIPLGKPDYQGMMAFAVVNGLAFGVYMAVDIALVNLVLPQAEDAGKDLGVMNISMALPQVLSSALGAVVISAVGYRGLFAVSGAVAIAGAIAVLPVKKVR
ncbi:MFS transporter [Streptomyces sp. ISL-44]|uniref:MFS transporter n=1 Tax=Streptomyces sp. ISL-44 TaxID=2819184 RepID=UPI001BEA9B3B|nr:MFS transporter [Streptomyces sp. ISL-44]MBT2542683.1 MFS transporter [Streptomyces sp. ISL-44]